MRLIRGLHNLSVFHSGLAQGSLVTIGNFDGVNLCHQQLINKDKHIEQQQ